VSSPSPARAAAVRVLEHVASRQAFADLALEAELHRRPLSERDTALATELVYGTLRWQRYLDWVLAPHSRRPLESLDPRPLVLLRLTAYQVVFLDRVPAFAAVNDAVSLARVRRTSGAPAFVNAVLRSFVRRGTAEREPAPPDDPLEALALRCSFPTWLAARWVRRYGPDAGEMLMRAMNERPSVTLRANTLKHGRDALAKRLRTEQHLASQPTRYAPEGLVVEHAGRPATWPTFADGLFAVQDEASMLVAHLVDPRPGEVIADACAAPGTKTTHLGQLMRNRGRILAFDPHPARLGLVEDSARRLGVDIIETLAGGVETLAVRFAEQCDAVLVDAPCSNLGVLRRNPEAKWRRQPSDLAASAARQREILTAAATMVKPGGRLVYATCSLEPEENEEVTRAFLDRRRDIRVDAPASFPLALEADGHLRCLPHRHGTDGFSAVRFERVARTAAVAAKASPRPGRGV
jgi:16S rRNA (cytosine967-C5)-methyltransferase